MGIKSFGKFRHCEVTHGEDLNMEAMTEQEQKSKRNDSNKKGRKPCPKKFRFAITK